MEIDLVWAAGTDLTLWYELIGRKGKVDLDGKEVVMEDGRRRRRRGRGRVMPASRTCYFSSVSNFQTKPNQTKQPLGREGTAHPSFKVAGFDRANAKDTIQPLSWFLAPSR